MTGQDKNSFDELYKSSCKQHDTPNEWVRLYDPLNHVYNWVRVYEEKTILIKEHISLLEVIAKSLFRKKQNEEKLFKIKTRIKEIEQRLSEIEEAEKKDIEPMTTIGEKRVRVKFNPAQSGVVDEIKQKTAELINICNKFCLHNPDIFSDKEAHRLATIAMEKYEEAAMWAVKAATVEKE
jgi:hypothetical protein